MSTKTIRGLGAHRCKDNIEEKAFADAWAASNASSSTLAHLLDQREDLRGKPPAPTDREAVVAATVVQWFGSQVGQGFLRDLGYSKAVEAEPDLDFDWLTKPRLKAVHNVAMGLKGAGCSPKVLEALVRLGFIVKHLHRRTGGTVYGMPVHVHPRWAAWCSSKVDTLLAPPRPPAPSQRPKPR